MAEIHVPDASARLLFQKQLLAVTNKIHSASNVNQLVLEVGADICDLFDADRALIYLVGEDEQTLVSKAKTDAAALEELSVPISDQSVPGYAALARKMVNIANVYDESEVKAINPELQITMEERAGGRDTVQVLAAPILDWRSHGALGVIELINNRSGEPFGQQAEEGLTELAQTIAVALRQRRKTQRVRTKYDLLVADAILAPHELDSAMRQASVRRLDIEQVLMEEFQVKPHAIGAALSKFFGVLYEPFSERRVTPKRLLKNLTRGYTETNQWLPIAGTKSEVVILCLDPERVHASRVVPNVFPKSRIVYRVTTVNEFYATVDQFYGVKTTEDPSDFDFSDRDADNFEKLFTRIIVNAYKVGNRDRLLQETANLWAHCLIMLGRHGLELSDVLAELSRRKGASVSDEEPG